jgi:Domain of unknown function (DUF4389)
MTEMPVGPTGTLEAPADPAGPGDEILVAFAEPAQQNRLTVLARIILAIPHLIVLWALGIAAQVVVIICWFAALFMGRLPDGLAGFLAGYLRWASRFYGYLFLLTDEYPPFELADAEYPVRVLVRPGRLNRLAVFFRLVLAIPAYVLAVLVLSGMETLVMFVTWLIVLIAGHMPRPLHEAIAAGTRYHIRFYGYLFLLTGTYPWGLFGDQPAPPGYFPAPGPVPGQPVPGQPVPAEPQQAGPASFSPPVPGQPGYAQPVPGPPGYADAPTVQPGYGQPGPQPPGYGGPGYGGGPEYGGPGYGGGPGDELAGSGPPGYPAAGGSVPPAVAGYVPPGEPVRWLGGDQPWRLVLSSSAKRLLGLFLVLGVVLFAGYLVAIIAATNSSPAVSRAEAAFSVEAAYSQLSSTLSGFDSKVSGCQGRLSCVNGVDGQMSGAFRSFANEMGGISMPDSASSAAAARVQADAAQAGRDFSQLSTASSVGQYRQIVVSTGLEPLLHKFDADYHDLGLALEQP